MGQGSLCDCRESPHIKLEENEGTGKARLGGAGRRALRGLGTGAWHFANSPLSTPEHQGNMLADRQSLAGDGRE